MRTGLDASWGSDSCNADVRFGVLLLARGPLMSLPIALATDYPPVQARKTHMPFKVAVSQGF